ncbi:MAG: methyltransferase domain-containing protein [Deltaproteobacteria bacterium]|nr:MAG: methyltransferase domain-containing protein [Deltaproteobacteria bacterium]
MCNKACIDFGRTYLKEEDVKGKSVIEVGSFDLNGSLRPIVEAFHPISYIGVDLQMGPGVDQICDAHDILDRFGYGTFDLLISTELLEHVRDWRKVISNFKHILKTNGVLIITTRSKGFYYHDYPTDFWRYEISDMQTIFSDFIIEVTEKDPIEPGIFIKARKPNPFTENEITNYQLYSILKDKHAKTITQADIYLFKLRSVIRQFLSQILPAGKLQS